MGLEGEIQSGREEEEKVETAFVLWSGYVLEVQSNNPGLLSYGLMG